MQTFLLTSELNYDSWCLLFKITWHRLSSKLQKYCKQTSTSTAPQHKQNKDKPSRIDNLKYKPLIIDRPAEQGISPPTVAELHNKSILFQLMYTGTRTAVQ